MTNNEVEAKTAAALRESGVYRGDPRFEARGIFERATRPRCEATITGNRPDGAPAEGEYWGGRPYAQGFEENVEFYRLDYLDVDEVSLGQQFQAIFPLLLDDHRRRKGAAGGEDAEGLGAACRFAVRRASRSGFVP